VAPETVVPDEDAAAPSQAPAIADGEAPFSPAIVKTAGAAPKVEKMKVRISADGRVTKQSLYHHDASAVPDAVKKAAEETYPGGTVLHYENERYADLGDVYEVEMKTKDGKECEVAAKEDGTVVYTECKEDIASTPDAIKQAVEAAVPGAKIEEYETKKGPGIDEVTIEASAGGKNYYLRIKPDGTMIEKLRRIPGLIEIPG
jgi:hypothetical protein